MAISMLIARFLLGAILVVFPTNALFLHWFKPTMPEKAERLMSAFRESGYMLPFIQGTELVLGLMLLLGWQLPLAALILFPISLHILLFHLFLAPPILGPGFLIFAINLFLIWGYRESYFGIIQ